MNLGDFLNQFKGDGSLKTFDRGDPEAVLLFNPSIGDVLEALDQQRELYLEKYEKLSERVDSLEGKVSDVSALITDLKESNASLDSKCKWIGNQLEEIRAEKVDKKVLKELRNEADRYREDWFRKRLAGTVNKLIRLYDDLEYLDDGESVSAWRKEILSILETQEVKRIERETDKFEPDYMKAVDVIEVARNEEDMAIREVLKEGFQYSDGKIIRPMEVRVARYPEEVRDE